MKKIAGILFLCITTFCAFAVGDYPFGKRKSIFPLPISPLQRGVGGISGLPLIKGGLSGISGLPLIKGGLSGISSLPLIKGGLSGISGAGQGGASSPLPNGEGPGEGLNGKDGKGGEVGGASLGDQYLIVGARGTFNSTWLYNKNQFNDKGIKYEPSWGGSGGIMLGFHYTRWGSVNAEALYSSFSQKLSSGRSDTSWTSRTNLAYWEFPLLLHFDYNTEKFKYIEAGIKFSSLYSASVSPALPNYDVKKNFEKQNLSAVFGWGAAFIGEGGMLINFGIRLTYGLSDIISNAGGKGKDYLPLADGANAQPKPYTPNNIATIGFHLSIDYDLGWFLYSSCHRKYKFFLL